MTAKSEYSKLSPSERLARKRAAARLRQQRCRARKRQAMLEKRRLFSEQEHRQVVTPESTTTTTAATTRPSVASLPLPTRHRLHPHPRLHSPHRIPATYGTPPHIPQAKASHPPLPTSGEHIYNCISFESQRSFEEAQKSLRVQTTSLENVSEHVAIVSPLSSPPRNPDTSIVRVLSDEKSDEQLVPEEEAAVAAMLSLKSGSEKPIFFSKSDEDRDQPPSSPPPAPKVVELPRTATTETIPTNNDANIKPFLVGMSKSYPAALPRPPLHHHHRRMEVPPHYEVFEYGPPPPPRRVSRPGYFYHHHRVPTGPPPPPYRRGYYAAAPRSFAVRYDYE